MVTGISDGAGPSRPAIAVARSCCTVPTTSPKLASLLDDIRLGSTTCTSARVIGNCVGPEVVERVAERIDAIAVDVRHGAGGAELEIAGQQSHADRVAGLQRPRVRRRMTPAPGDCELDIGTKPAARERRRHRIEHRRVEPRRDHRHGDRPQHGAHAAKIRRTRRTSPAPATARRRTAATRPRSRDQMSSSSRGVGGQRHRDRTRARAPRRSSSSRRSFRRSA